MVSARHRPHLVLVVVLGLVLFASALPSPALAHRHGATVRFATYNASLSPFAEGELGERLRTRDDAQAQQIAAIIQRVRPDVLLLNEFNYDPSGVAPRLFIDNYLRESQGRSLRAIDYPYVFAAPSNTGVASGFDLDNNGEAVTEPGSAAYANDARGFGFFPGHFGMVVLSRYPIATGHVRTFQMFRWQDMPDALLPADFYGPEEAAAFRLSSKSHWDVPIRVRGRTMHLLASHPTPPVFDGPEDRNGRRNHDEIRFWADYVTPGRGDYIYDDAGRHGGLERGARFVIAGDLNADPFDGDSTGDPIGLLLDQAPVRVRPVPRSPGAVIDSRIDGGINLEHEGNPAFDTADFGEPPGNLRVDYVLPSRNLRVRRARVFWPVPGAPGHELIDASDHRLVWIDVRLRR